MRSTGQLQGFAPQCLLAATALLALIFQAPIPLLIASVLLATNAGVPRKQWWRYWPYGLLILLIEFYVFYVFLWLQNSPGITRAFSCVSWLTILFVNFAISVFRTNHRESPDESKYSISEIILILAVSIGVIAVGTYKFYFDRNSLVAGFLAGGDHGLHVEFVISLIRGANEHFFSSPISISDYPRGIHFVLANLLMIGSDASAKNIEARHLIPAWFEYVQLAAVVHLLVSACLVARTRAAVSRSLAILCIVSSIASINKLVNFLFWSGFSTSLATIWILLVPLSLMSHQIKLTARGTFAEVGYWFLITAGIWIVYQPYVLIPGCLLFMNCVSLILRRNVEVEKVRLQGTLIFVVASVGLATLSPYLIHGAKDPGLQRLILFGVTWKASFTTVIIWAIVATLLILVKTQKSSMHQLLDRKNNFNFFLGLITFTFTMMVLAAHISDDFTFLSQPYYVQKMFWLVFIVSIVLVLKWGFLLLNNQNGMRIASLNSRYVAVALVALLVPFVMNRTPVEASRHIAIDWFAQDLNSHLTKDELARSSVFHSWENLGAHVGNIAIRQESTDYLPIDIAQSRNSYWACDYIRKTKAETILTATNERNVLVDAGCDPNVLYVESGVRIRNTESTLNDMVIGKRIRTNSDTRGVRFLMNGFSQPQPNGTDATGFYSRISFRSFRENKPMKLSLSVNPRSGSPLAFDLRLLVNNRLVRVDSFRAGAAELQLGLPALKNKDRVALEILCHRSEQEIIEMSSTSHKLPCMTVKSFRLDSEEPLQVG